MNPVFQFDPSQERLIRVPESFFTQVLATSQDIQVQRLTLFAFWLLDIQERDPKYLTLEDFLAQEAVCLAFQAKKTSEPHAAIHDALEKTVLAGILLQMNFPGSTTDKKIYFINSPKGRASATALANGDWKIQFEHQQPVKAQLHKPNIFKLYEDHIGTITPIMAEFLQEAENLYPAEQIQEAFEIAVTKNVRNWRYIEAILKRWQENGKDGESRQNTEKPWQKYLEGEYGDNG
jgi:DnaD/phage-associated family protein